MNRWWDDNGDLVILFTVIGTVLLVLFGCALGASVTGEIGYCNTQAELSSDFEFKWTFWGGCMVHLDDGSWAYAPDYMNKLRFEGELND